MINVIEFQGREIEVEEIESDSFNFILFKAKHSNDYYLDILLNHSFAYYDKLVKVNEKDMIEYFENKIPIHRLVDNYR